MRTFNINVNGKSFEVAVEETTSGAPSIVAPAPVVAAAPVSAPAVVGGAVVTSPLPGLILKLLVANGTRVKKGEKIVVIEAMKMENDIVSSADGVVTYLVKEGDTVDVSTKLASIK